MPYFTRITENDPQNHVTRHFRDLRERTRHNTIPPDFRDAVLGFLLANLLWISRRNLDISISNKDLETANCLYIKKEKFNVLFMLFIMYRNVDYIFNSINMT